VGAVLLGGSAGPLAPVADSKTAVTSEPGATGDRSLSILLAVREALTEEMGRDERVMILGLDVATMGGVFRVTSGLLQKFGAQRVIDTPLAEGAIVGSSLGLAIGGMIPVVEIQFLGFTQQAFHQIGAQLGRYRFRSRGRYHAQVTLRAPFGGGVRAPEFHADSLEALFAQAPGLKVVCPAFPDDAKGMLLSAIRDPDPVLFLEPQRLYRSISGQVPKGDVTVPLGVSRLVREGTDLTLIAWSAAVHTCLDAADSLAEEGVSAAVLDLRSITPLDVDGLVESVLKTGKAVVVHEAPLTSGFGAEVVATLQHEAFWDLDAPVARVTGLDIPYPPGSLEDHYLPSVGRVIEAARATVNF
jgi:pyruvate dehydrogenase E1 component beta subunit